MSNIDKNKSEPVFSVVTVTYNASKWLEKTIQSILEQSYSKIEYLIVDGGSTDGTLDIIKKYEDKIFWWISEPDNGLYDAMNKGIKKASGDYIWFINAGDRLEEEMTIEKIVASLSGNSELPDVIYGETAIINKKGEVVGMRRLKAPEKLTWKSFRMGMLVCHQSFIVKRELAPLYDTTYRLSADYDWCIQCLKKARTIHNTHLNLSRFLEEGVSSKQRKASLKERFRIMCNYYGTIPTVIRHGWFAIRFYTAKLIRKRV